MNSRAAALLAANQQGIDTWSKLGPKLKSNRIDRACKTILPVNVPVSTTCAAIYEGTIRWAYIEEDATVAVVTRPIRVDPHDGEPKGYFVCHNSDELQSFVPAKFSSNAFEGRVITMMSAETCAKHGFPELTQAPDMAKKPDGSGTNTLSELGFPNADESTQPKFVVIGKLIPIPLGYAIPEGHKISNDLPPAQDGQEYWEPFVAWANSIKKMYEVNGGKPATADSSNLFDPKSVEVSADYPSMLPSSTFVTTLEPMRRSNPKYQQAKEEANHEGEQAIFNWYMVSPQAPPGTSPQAAADQVGGPPPTWLPTLLAALPKQAKDTEATNTAKEKETVKMMYKILFARNAQPEDCEHPIMVPADLTQEFEAFLDAPKVSKPRVFRENFKHILETKLARSDTIYDQGHTWEPRRVLRPMINGFDHFEILDCNLNQDRPSVNDKISVVHFLTINKRKGNYEEMALRDLEQSRDERVGEDIRKMAKKDNRLYYQGHQETHQHLLELLFNINAFGQFVTADFHASQMWKSLKAHLTVIMDPQNARPWFRDHTDYPHLVHMMVMEVQDIFQIFVQIATTMEHRIQLSTPGGTVSEAPLKRAANHCKEITRETQRAILSASIRNYCIPPMTFQIFHHKNPNDYKKRSNSERDRNPRVPKESRTTDDEKTKLGLLRWTGNGAPPTPTTLIDHPVTKEKARLCRDFTYTGRACSFRECKFIHCVNLSKLPQAEQKKLTEWVEKTTDVHFNRNMGPTPVPRTSATEIDDSDDDQPPPLLPHRIDEEDDEATETVEPEPEGEQHQAPLKIDPPAKYKAATGPKPQSVKVLSPQEIQQFHETLPTEIQAYIDQPFGKFSSNHSFTVEPEFRHILNTIHKSGFMSRKSKQALAKAEPLYEKLIKILREYRRIDFSELPGFNQYREYATEEVLNEARTAMTTAALVHYNFSLSTLVRFVGGPHVGAQRSPSEIMESIAQSVNPRTKADIERILIKGAPAHCNAHSTAQNFKEFYKHGNHQSAVKNPDKMIKVFTKDCRRGHALAMDIRVLPYVYPLHLTPMGIVDIDNPWRSDRPVFDSSFHPSATSMAINDWTTPDTEPELIFPTAFAVFLKWVWNLRITYPNRRILLGDNDITGAFRLVKYHPEIVPLHGYTINSKYLAAATGTTFGDNTSPANFEPFAIARNEHASHLWEHSKAEVLQRAADYIQEMIIPEERNQTESTELQQANEDSLNPGVMHKNGYRLPPVFPHHVDDNFFADVIEYIRLTSGASIVALEDVFGKKHPHQPDTLSGDKLNLEYAEKRDLIGNNVDTVTMRIKITERRRQKLIQYITVEEWETRNSATLSQIATLHGLLVNAARYSPWGQCQFFAIQGLLRQAIQTRYNQVKGYNMRNRISIEMSQNMPAPLQKRVAKIVAQQVADYIWRSKAPITIPTDVKRTIRQILKYLQRGGEWSQYIGHLVPRDPATETSSDASNQAIGVILPELEIFCFIPYGKELFNRVRNKMIHINTTEFIGTMLTYIIFQAEVSKDRTKFPPVPIHKHECDNTSAVHWCARMAAATTTGQRVLRLFAEFRKDSEVSIDCHHIKGTSNTDPDIISRPCECFEPHLYSPTDRSFPQLVAQICQSLPKLKSYKIFLPSQSLFSCLKWVLSPDSRWEIPKIPATKGQLKPVDYIFSDGFYRTNSSTTYFL